MVLPQPVCLERGVSYTLRLELGCATARQDSTASVLIDSVRGHGMGHGILWGRGGAVQGAAKDAALGDVGRDEVTSR